MTTKRITVEPYQIEDNPAIPKQGHSETLNMQTVGLTLDQEHFVTWVKVEDVDLPGEPAIDKLSELKLASYTIKEKLSKTQMQSFQNKKNWANKMTITDVIEKLNKKGYRDIYALDYLNGNTLCTLEPKITKDGQILIEYTDDTEEFAVMLNYHSPAAYNYARNALLPCLPHPLAISKWYLATDGDPGLTEEAFEALQNYCHSEKKLACLLVDEWEISQYQNSFGIPVDSYVTYGPEEEIARNVFLFMLVSLDGSFKLPLGYFYIKNLAAEQRCNLIKLCLERCHDAGAEVVSLTLDGWSSNTSTAKLLGCNFEDFDNLKTHFLHPVTKKPVVVIFDQWYILKHIQLTLERRNTLIDQNGGEIQWQHLQKLKNVQDNLGKYLEGKIITPSLFELRSHLLNLKLPAQYFSEGAANALKMCANGLKLPEYSNADATIHFIQVISTVFDILNTKLNTKSLNAQRIPIDNKDELFQILNSVETYLWNLKVQVMSTDNRNRNNTTTTQQPLMNTQTKQGFLGLLICIHSFKKIFKELVEKRRILKFIPSYNFNLDHLVFLFAEIHIGHKTPNTRQFKELYKKLALKLKLPSKLTQNSIFLDHVPILNCAAEINKTTPGFRMNYHEDRKTREPSEEEMEECLIVSKMLDDNNPMQEAVGYLLGYIAEQLRAKLECNLCLKLIPPTKYFNFHKLISLKEFEEVTYPSIVLFKICLATEIFIKQLVRMNKNDHCLAEESNLQAVMKECFASVIEKDDIRKILQRSHPCDSLHDSLFLRCAIEQYLKVRLHFAMKKRRWLSGFLPRPQVNVFSCR